MAGKSIHKIIEIPTENVQPKAPMLEVEIWFKQGHKVSLFYLDDEFNELNDLASEIQNDYASAKNKQGLFTVLACKQAAPIDHIPDNAYIQIDAADVAYIWTSYYYPKDQL